MRKVIIALAGTVAIATLSHSAMVSPEGLSHFKAATAGHKYPPAGASDKTNSPSVDPHYRIPGTNGPVWPPGLPFEPFYKTNR